MVPYQLLFDDSKMFLQVALSTVENTRSTKDFISHRSSVVYLFFLGLLIVDS